MTCYRGSRAHLPPARPPTGGRGNLASFEGIFSPRGRGLQLVEPRERYKATGRTPPASAGTRETALLESRYVFFVCLFVSAPVPHFGRDARRGFCLPGRRRWCGRDFASPQTWVDKGDACVTLPAHAIRSHVVVVAERWSTRSGFRYMAGSWLDPRSFEASLVLEELSLARIEQLYYRPTSSSAMLSIRLQLRVRGTGALF